MNVVESPPLPTPSSPPLLGSRALFPSLEARAYLNHASIAPPSTPVLEAVRACAADSAARGAGAFPTWLAQRDRLRARVAEWLGAESASTIGLIAGTTRGVIDVANSLDWREGERVVLFEGEFPANVTPWLQACRTYGLTPVWQSLQGFGDGSGRGLERLENALREGARLVALSAVQFQTGLRLPLEAIGRLCREHGAELFVDAIQGLGAVEIPLDHVDYLVAGAHKWLGSIEGAALLYVRPERAPGLVPRMAGWTSHDEGLRFLFEGPGHLRYDRGFHPDARVFEPGISSAIGFAALETSIALLQSLGVAAVAAHAQAYHDALEPRLLELGFRSARATDPAARSGILSLQPPPGVDPVPLPERLAALGVACSIPDGYLRLAPHWSNDLDEVEHVAQSVRAAVRHSP